MATTAQQVTSKQKPEPHKWVYLFSEGNAKMRDLLGGKGAGVAEMTNAGLPVPPGFTITTEACNAYYRDGKQFPAGMWHQALAALHAVEEQTGKQFGDRENPLLVSVRSGAKFSMPGMMDTVLNLGLNDETVQGLIAQIGDERFAYDAYRRFMQMFSKIVLDADPRAFEARLEAGEASRRRHRRRNSSRGAQADRRGLQADRRRADGQAVPHRSLEQLQPGDRGRFLLVEQRSRHRLSQRAKDSARPGHRRQRADDGLWQHGLGFRHRRGVYPRSQHRREEDSTPNICPMRRAKMSWPAFARR